MRIGFRPWTLVIAGRRLAGDGPSPERGGASVVESGSERWLRLGPTAIALSCLNALVLVALTVNADLVDVLGLPAGWGELAQQPWTALTVMFTSGNIAHLLGAVVVIAVAGGALERRVGSVHLLAIYLLSGLAASAAIATAASAGVGGSERSLGASGAFLGLVGALAVMPASRAALERLHLPKVVTVIVVVNLLAPALGLGDWTSTAAHLTGLAVGALYALCTGGRRKGHSPVSEPEQVHPAAG
jgi:membrane associated rhomboid family serine protease